MGKGLERNSLDPNTVMKGLNNSGKEVNSLGPNTVGRGLTHNVVVKRLIVWVPTR